MTQIHFAIWKTYGNYLFFEKDGVLIFYRDGDVPVWRAFMENGLSWQKCTFLGQATGNKENWNTHTHTKKNNNNNLFLLIMALRSQNRVAYGHAKSNFESVLRK